MVPLVSFLSLASSFLRSLQAREHPDARSRVTVGNMTMHQECCQHRLVIRDVYGSLCLDYRGCRAPKITWLLILASLFPGFFLRNGMVSSGRQRWSIKPSQSMLELRRRNAYRSNLERYFSKHRTRCNGNWRVSTALWQQARSIAPRKANDFKYALSSVKWFHRRCDLINTVGWLHCAVAS